MHRYKQQPQALPCWAVNTGDDRRTKISILTLQDIYTKQPCCSWEACAHLKSYPLWCCSPRPLQELLSWSKAASMAWSYSETSCCVLWGCSRQAQRRDFSLILWRKHKASIHGRIQDTSFSIHLAFYWWCDLDLCITKWRLKKSLNVFI